MKKNYLVFAILLLIFSSKVSAQTGDIRGFIYEEASSEPAIYTSVYLKGTTYGAQTNLDGFFSISKVPPGEYQLFVSSIGYDYIQLTMSVKSGELITQKLYLT